MGCVYNRGSPTKPIWWIKWREDGRARYRRVGPDHRLAERVLKKIEGDVVAGKVGLPDESAPNPAAVSFREVAEPWVEKRRETHRAARDDIVRMNRHLLPFFGAMPLNEIGVKEVRQFIERKRKELSRQTIVNCLSLVSRMFNDLIGDGLDVVNPVARLDRSTRRAIGPKYDPRRTPFLRTKDNIRAVYFAMPAPPSPLRAAFAVGVFAGLRTGEMVALERGDVDLARRLIHVQRSAKGRVKDDDSRFVPINDSLLPILREWMLRCPAGPLLFPGGGRGTRGKHGQRIQVHTLYKYLRRALAACDLPRMTWYQATRHTYASHFVMDGGQIERLAQILGHSSPGVTQRYCHLLPDRFGPMEYRAGTVDLTPSEVVVIEERRAGR